MLLGLLLPRQADGQNRYRVLIIPISNLNTKIRISHVQISTQAYVTYECVGFVNNSDRVVAAIRFRFTYVDANRHAAGFDPIERRGPFEPGAGEDVPQIVPGQMYERGALERFHNCQSFKFPNDNIAYLVATVDRVEFADGSVWEDVHRTAVPAPTSTPGTSATPEATPTASATP